MDKVMSVEYRHLRPPPYFERIREAARSRWDQLEADPELAGPWRQLFSQVQSPRHVLSELLQNADDAGAHSVRVAIRDGYFIFEHDGRDFVECEFRSLCGFGFSNKRNLHTIGFRGIGFKSTFSIGSQVEVLTPTLAVRFHKDRFTEPLWLEGTQPTHATQIQARIEDLNRECELRKNLNEWRQSAVSLLFLQNVRSLTIGEQRIVSEQVSSGPVTNSNWVRLRGERDQTLLVIKSELEAFPQAALNEVRNERNVTGDLDLPPCAVEIVLGIDDDQRLYVVLPTGVRPPLPFSINAPFIQDPGRFGIKDPAISDTNRWLLERASALAADSFTSWLANTSLNVPDRARAYDLLPKPFAEDRTSAESCAQIVAKEFGQLVDGKRILLTSDGKVCPNSPA